jgi:transcription-repair coupling factor (superfamily II helicase)
VTAGLTPAAKALNAVIAARLSRDVTLLVAPTDKDVEQLTADARFFTAHSKAPRPRTSNARSSVSVAAGRSLPRDDAALPRGVGARPCAACGGHGQRATHHCLGSCASATRESSRTLPRRLAGIRSGTEIEPQRLADLLVDAGFTREDPVDEHGSFTIRGGIVDIFPAADVEPVRIEFVGDMVETLRRFDPATQRSTGPTDQVAVVPVRSALTTSTISCRSSISSRRPMA